MRQRWRLARVGALGLTLCALASPRLARAADDGPSLLYDPFTIETARMAGMGRVASVAGDGTSATWWNPALLAFRPEHRFTVSSADLTVPFFADEDYIRSATLSGPLSFGPKGLAAGVGFKRMSLGDIGLTGIDGEPIETSVFDNLYTASLAYSISPHLSLGAQLEYLWSHPTDAIPQLNIPEDVTGGAAAMGLGIAYERPIAFSLREDLSASGDGARVVLTPMAGASLLHLGQELDYGDDDEGADLFRQFRLGAGLGVEHAPTTETKPFARERLRQFHFTTALEVFVPMVDLDDITQESLLLHWGAELSWFGMVSGRIGFIDDDDVGMVSRDNTYGVGLSLPDGLPFDVSFDWASVPIAATERIERRTLSITFGGGGS
jgi:hypothetical protein